MNNIKYKCSNFYFASAKSNKKKLPKYLNLFWQKKYNKITRVNIPLIGNLYTPILTQKKHIYL